MKRTGLIIYINHHKELHPSSPLVFRNMFMDHYDFSLLDLKNAVFDNCVISHCKFDKANMSGASLTNTSIRQSSFKDVEMNNISFTCDGNANAVLDLFDRVVSDLALTRTPLSAPLQKSPPLKGIIKAQQDENSERPKARRAQQEAEYNSEAGEIFLMEDIGFRP